MNSKRATEEETTPPGRRAGSAWCLISRDGGGRTDVLTVDSGGEDALAVFSFDEEAELFLQMETTLGDGWRIEPVAADELFSQLLGSRSPFRRVALDPFPEVAGRRMVELVCVSRERFIQAYGSGHPERNDTRLRTLS